MDQLWLDIRFSLRQLRHNPVFAVTAVLTMAQGIAAVAIVYAVFDTVVIAG